MLSNLHAFATEQRRIPVQTQFIFCDSDGRPRWKTCPADPFDEARVLDVYSQRCVTTSRAPGPPMTTNFATCGRSCPRFPGIVRLTVVALIFSLSLPCGLGRGEDASTKTLGPPGRLGLAIDDSLVPGRLVVVEVEPSGPAAKAGVRPQDMVLAIDGEPTLDAERFAAAIATIGPGDNVRFAIGRGGVVEEVTLVADGPAAAPRSTFGQPASAPSAFPSTTGPFDAGQVAAAAIPEPPDAAAPSVSTPAFTEPRPSPDRWPDSTGRLPPARTPPAENSRGKKALGVRTVPVDPVAQARYSLSEPTGALVVGLLEDLPASRAGLPTGSVIVAFDRQPVRSPTELTKLVSEGPTDRPVKLEYILPGGESRAADVSLVNVTAQTAAAMTDAEMRNSATVSPTPVNPGATAPADRFGGAAGSDREALRLEILQMRKAIDSLVRRLEDLERRGSMESR